MSITIQVKPLLEQRLRRSAAAKGQSVDQFVSTFLENNLSDPSSESLAVSHREAALLQNINLNIPAETWGIFHALKQKQREDNLSDTELVLYQQLAEKFELANAERLQVLFELAQLRQVSLRQVMQDLGIAPPIHD